MRILISLLFTLILIILFIVIYLLFSSESGTHLDREWLKYKQKFNKTYLNETEDAKRRHIYVKNKQFIQNHNQKYAKGLETYKLGINHYADLNDHEYIGSFHKDHTETDKDDYEENDNSMESYEILNHFQNLTEEQRQLITESTLECSYSYEENLPENVDWVKYGYDTPVIDQGKCGSCYIFSGLAAIEAHYYIKYKTLLQLSHQEILDCTHILASTGCNGGFIEDVYNYGIVFGVGLADQNPYLGNVTHECRRKKPRIFIKKQYYGRNVTEESLKEVIALHGPVSSPINAGLRTFKFYKEGIYYDPNCSTEKLEHAIATVGYGVNEKGQEYWLIKNSFGKDWGVNGYMHIARNRDNHCGIASEYIFPQF